MVGGKADDRIFQLSCRIQLFNQILQRQVQLHVAGNVGSSFLGIRQICHILFVQGRHLVAGEIIIHVTGNRHVIHMETVLLYVLRYRCFHHIQIRSRPVIGVFHGKYLTAVFFFIQIS